MHGSNLELCDNKREPPNRVEKAKASTEKKISNSSRVGYRISSWLITREPPNRVEWAKASIEKKISNSSRVGSGQVGSVFESRAG